MIVAGYETTASTLNWISYLLLEHPAVEAKLHAEVDGLLSDEIPSFDDLTTLVYAKQIIDETLRLYPPVWLFSRRAITEDHIDGYYIAPSRDIFMAPYFVHRHPQFWRIHKHSDRSALSRMRSVNAISLLIFPFPWVSDGASGGSLLWWRCRFIWAQSPNICACAIFPSVPSSLSRTSIFARGTACT